MSTEKKRIYHAPLGATSITVAGRTFEVDAQGRLECDDEAAHDDLLAHGYTYGEAPAAAATVADPVTFERALNDAREELAARARELDDRAERLSAEGIELVAQRAAADARAAELDELAATLAASRTELANKETDLAIRVHQLETREAALAAAVPPPPKANKAKA